MTPERRWRIALILLPFALILGVVAFRWYAQARRTDALLALEARGEPTRLDELVVGDREGQTVQARILALSEPPFDDRPARLRGRVPDDVGSEAEVVAMTGELVTHVLALENDPWSGVDGLAAASIVDALAPELEHLRGLTECTALGWGPLVGCGVQGIGEPFPWAAVEDVANWLELALGVAAGRGDHALALEYAECRVALDGWLDELPWREPWLRRAAGRERFHRRLVRVLQRAPDGLDVSELERLVRATRAQFDHERWFDALRVVGLRTMFLIDDAELARQGATRAGWANTPLVGRGFLDLLTARFLELGTEIESDALADPPGTAERLLADLPSPAPQLSVERVWAGLLLGTPPYEAPARTSRDLVLSVLATYRQQGD